LSQSTSNTLLLPQVIPLIQAKKNSIWDKSRLLSGREIDPPPPPWIVGEEIGCSHLWMLIKSGDVQSYLKVWMISALCGNKPTCPVYTNVYVCACLRSHTCVGMRARKRERVIYTVFSLYNSICRCCSLYAWCKTLWTMFFWSI
jgi:hypothetical protein